MGLFRAIVGGFGFTIGARAADAAIDEAAEALEDHEKQQKVAGLARVSELKAYAQAQAKKKKTTERDVERELAAMKKRLAKEAKK